MATTGSGGAIAGNDVDIFTSNTEFRGNSALGSHNGYGGAIFNDRGDVRLYDSTVEMNTAGVSGGGIAGREADVNITNSSISSNTAETGGGGILVTNARLRIDGSTINDNSAGGYGGGIANYTQGDDTQITDTTISGNYAQFGGGVFTNNDTKVEIRNSTISDNGAYFVGGGIYARSGGTLLIQDSLVSNNEAINVGGGVITGSDFLLVNSQLSENSAFEGGGLLAGETASGAIIGTSILRNTTYEAGAGVSFRGAEPGEASTALTIVNSTIAQNSTFSAFGSGGGIRIGDSSETSIVNSTITSNYSSGNGGGISVQGAKVKGRHARHSVAHQLDRRRQHGLWRGRRSLGRIVSERK